MEWLAIIPVIVSALTTIALSSCFYFIKNHKIADCAFPKVSIVITARNEEKDIQRCIDSLARLSYPKDKLQIILVDDRSTDKTAELIKKAVAENEHFLFADTKHYKGHLEAKARGLHCGIAIAKGEWILISDADAKVPEKWVETMVSGAGQDVACISGPLNIPSSKIQGIVEKISYAFAVPIAYGFSNFIKPFFCIGPNMAIRKSVYDEAGGLESADFKVAEDLAIFRLGQKSGLRTLYKSHKDSLIEITPVPSLSYIKSQVVRWIGGGYEQGKDVVFILTPWLLISFLSSSMLLFSHFWIGIDLFWFLWFIKICSDTFVLLVFYLKTRARNLLVYLPVFWTLGTIIFFLLPFLLVSNRRVTWKGEGYEIKY